MSSEVVEELQKLMKQFWLKKQRIRKIEKRSESRENS